MGLIVHRTDFSFHYDGTSVCAFEPRDDQRLAQ
jgi:hypothetical protein